MFGGLCAAQRIKFTMFRRLLLAIAIFVLLAVVFWRRSVRPRAVRTAPAVALLLANTGVPGAAAVTPSASSATAATEPRSTLADRLNAVDGTIQADLRILQEILVAWRTNLPRAGNPVGENAEITAVLTGENPLQLALIPKDHPAIDRAGALCDRWGTPFRFHQISGTQMEIRSAGPDRKFGTADDAVF